MAESRRLLPLPTQGTNANQHLHTLTRLVLDYMNIKHETIDAEIRVRGFENGLTPAEIARACRILTYSLVLPSEFLCMLKALGVKSGNLRASDDFLQQLELSNTAETGWVLQAVA